MNDQSVLGMATARAQTRQFLPRNSVCIFFLKCVEVEFFLAVAETIESNWTEMVKNFDEMNLPEPLLRGIYGYGFERPSAIQQRAIKPCILGK
jgi:hypothetical protein